jgi:hypothetical protein
MSTRAKWMVFLLLLSTWAGIAVWLLMETSEPQRVPRKFISGQTASQGVARGQVNSALRVDLPLLMANRQNADNSFIAPKNIFRPLKTERERDSVVHSPPSRREVQRHGPAPVTPVAPPAPAPAPPSPLPMAIPPVAPPAAPPGPTSEELARLAGRQELSQYRYLGYLIRNGKDEAFLSKGSTLHIVKTGETIDQRVLVKAIAPTGVTLQETASQVEHTVMLVP